MKTERVPGIELKVGDTIETWWRPGRDTITALRPYDGTLLSVLGADTRIAEFAVNTIGMTIPGSDYYTRVVIGHE